MRNTQPPRITIGRPRQRAAVGSYGGGTSDERGNPFTPEADAVRPVILVMVRDRTGQRGDGCADCDDADRCGLVWVLTQTGADAVHPVVPAVGADWVVVTVLTLLTVLTASRLSYA